MAINMDAVLELSAKVDGMSQLLQLERSLADVKGELNKYDKANKDAGLSTKEMGLMMTAASFAGNLLADAAQNLLANLQSMATSTIQSGLAFEQTETRIRMLSEGYGEFDAVQGLITQNAALLGQSQVQAANGFADIYARLRPLGISLEDINAVYLGFNSLAMQSGTTAEAASGAFMQLSQALGSGTLRGDEFNSVAEQVPGILLKVAEVMGQPVGALRGLAAEGKITSTVVIEAMQRAAAEGGANLEQLSGSAAMSVGRMNNAFTDLQAQVGKEFVPLIAESAKELTRLAKAASESLVPAIRQVVTEYGLWQKALQGLANDAEFELAAFSTALQNVYKDGDLVSLAIQAIADVISGPLASAIAGSALKEWLKGAADEMQYGWTEAAKSLVEKFGIVDGVFKSIAQTVGGPLATFFAGFIDTDKLDAFTKGFVQLIGYTDAYLDNANAAALAWNEQNAKAQEAKAAAEKLNEQAKRQREELERQAGAKERLKDLTEKMNADYQLMGDALKQQTAEYEAQIEAVSDAMSYEKARLDLLEDQLKRQLEKAKTYKEEEQILLQLRNIELRNAELNYQAALTAIDQGIFKVELERDQLDLKLAQAQAALRLAEAEGLVTTALKLAVDTTINALNLANQQIDRAVDHGKVLAANAALQKQQAVETAQAKYEQALLTAQTKATEQAQAQVTAEVARTSDELDRATSAAINLEEKVKSVAVGIREVNGVLQLTYNGFMAASEIAKLQAEFADQVAERAEKKRMAALQEELNKLSEKESYVQRINDLYAKGTQEAEKQAKIVEEMAGSMIAQEAASQRMQRAIVAQKARSDKLIADLLAGIPRMAVGGYVTKPTPALIGEGGEPEYVIPASKMATASTAFLGGARGGQVLQQATSTSSGPMAVNIQTGPVMSMGGQQYVNKTDLSMAVTQAVQQTMALLTGNSNVRQLVGI